MKYKLVQSIEAPSWFNPVAITSFGNVKEGDVGGFIKGERNLAQDGTCWVYDDAKVCDDARIEGNAKIHDHCVISGHATIGDEVIVSDSSAIEDATLAGSIDVCGYTNIKGDIVLSGALVLRDVAIREGTTYNYTPIKASIKSADTAEDNK